MVRRTDFIQGLVEKIIESLLDVAADLLLAASGASQENRRRGRLGAADALLMIVRHLRAAFGLGQYVVQVVDARRPQG